MNQFLSLQPEQVPLDDTLIVSRYLNNPLVIDGKISSLCCKFEALRYIVLTLSSVICMVRLALPSYNML